MIKLYIHVGMGKSGSSAIQHTCKTNSEYLLSEGFKYVGLCLDFNTNKTHEWQKPSGWGAFIQKPIAKANQELTSELTSLLESTEKEGLKGIIWSNESLFDNIEFIKPTLSAISKIAEIKIIGYIRRPDQWITSAFFQWGIKDKGYKGEIKAFSEWTNTIHYNPIKQINKYDAIIPNSKFYNYNEIQDVSFHFLSLVIPNLDKNKINSQRIYKTPDSSILALWYYYNDHSENEISPAELQRLIIHSQISDFKFNGNNFNSIIPTQGKVEDFVNNHSTEISALNAYFEKNGEKTFETDYFKVQDYSVNQNQINKILIKIIKHQDDKLHTLEQRISRLEKAMVVNS